MIPAAVKRYFNSDYFHDWNELSYPENWRSFIEHWENYDEHISSAEDMEMEITNRNYYFFHCLPVVLGIRNTDRHGHPAAYALGEYLAGARDYGVSVRCKFLV